MKIKNPFLPLVLALTAALALSACGSDETTDNDSASTTTEDAGSTDDGISGSATGLANCDEMAALFVNAPSTVTTADCQLTDGTTTPCCTLTFRSDLEEDGPYCPESLTSPPPYGLSVYDGETNPGLRPFNGAYLLDIEADGYDPMVDADGNTNINTGGIPGDGSNCLAMDSDPDLIITVHIPLTPKASTTSTTIASVENLGVSVYGIPATGEPPSAVDGPMMGPGGPGGPTTGGSSINVPSIGSCGAHPDPAGYLHDHFVPQVMNLVLAANGISSTDVECTRYEQSTTGLYGFAKDGYPIYSSRDNESTLPTDLDECHGHISATADFPGGIYHYHADEELAPNYPACLNGVAVSRSFTYQ